VVEYLAQFARFGRDTACVFPRGYRMLRWSYAELLAHAQRFATLLDDRGIGKGDRIMVWGVNCGEWLGTFWGSLLRGTVIVPMDRAASPEFAARVFDQVNAKLLVSSRGLTLSAVASTLHFEDFSFLPTARDLSPVSSTRDDAVQIVFTSGTTGEPKGVVITHGNILANLEPIESEIQKYLRYERIFHPLRFLNLLPLSHVFGQFMGIFVPPLLGATVLFLESIKPAEIAATVRDRRVSILITVPRLLGSLRAMLEAELREQMSDDRLRTEMERASREHFGWRWWRFRRVHSRCGWKFWAIVSGGATLDHDDEEFWRRLGFAVIQGYGLTETTSLVSVNHPFKLGRGSVGKALPGRELRVDESGEILVRGDSIAKSYWIGGEQIAAGEGEWFRTGDLGAVDEAGNLYFKGRKKNVIVTAEGMNVYPEDLESALRSDAAVRDCVVIGVERGGNAEPCAVLIVNHGAEAASRAVKQANARLGAHQRIRHWVVWPDSDFPRTSTQKPRQDLISAYARAQIDHSGNGTMPRSAIELAIAGLSKSGLQAQKDSRLEDDLNLSSIDRVELLTALEQRYQVELDESRFAEATTVADVERILRQASAAPARSRYDYPRWVQTWPVRLMRNAVYYLLTWPATRILGKPTVVGRERLKSAQGPLLFISNHVTYIDAGLLMFAMPARYRNRLAIAMQGEMLAAMRNPPEMNFLGRAVEIVSYWLVTALFDVFPLPQRSGFRESFAFAGESMDRGYSLIVFPEGRRTTDGEMAAFRGGIGILAQQLKVPVVPMRIDGLFPLKNEERHFARQGEIKVIVGEPVQFSASMTEEEIALELENRVKSL
jgi:long-chain acyl-CoA synthetase